MYHLPFLLFSISFLVERSRVLATHVSLPNANSGQSRFHAPPPSLSTRSLSSCAHPNTATRDEAESEARSVSPNNHDLQCIEASYSQLDILTLAKRDLRSLLSHSALLGRRTWLASSSIRVVSLSQLSTRDSRPSILHQHPGLACVDRLPPLGPHPCCMEHVVAVYPYPHPYCCLYHQLPQPPLPFLSLPFCLQRLHPLTRPRIAAPPLVITSTLVSSPLYSRPKRCIRPSQYEPFCFADHVAHTQRRGFRPLLDHFRRDRPLAAEP